MECPAKPDRELLAWSCWSRCEDVVVWWTAPMESRRWHLIFCSKTLEYLVNTNQLVMDLPLLILNVVSLLPVFRCDKDFKNCEKVTNCWNLQWLGPYHEPRLPLDMSIAAVMYLMKASSTLIEPRNISCLTSVVWMTFALYSKWKNFNPGENGPMRKLNAAYNFSVTYL